MKPAPAAILLLPLLLVLSVGCAPNATTRWAQANQALEDAMRAISDAAEAGYVRDRQLVAASKVARGAERALDQAETELDRTAGQGGERFERLISTAERVIVELERIDAHAIEKSVETHKAKARVTTGGAAAEPSPARPPPPPPLPPPAPEPLPEAEPVSALPEPRPPPLTLTLTRKGHAHGSGYSRCDRRHVAWLGG